ncbi:MAG: hypothetical protein AB1810_14430 [Pseudomonadota bacterium]
MLQLRRHILNNAYLWTICLASALVFVFCVQPHIHIHTDHQHTADVAPHPHQADVHQSHLGNTHDAEHGSAAHLEHETYVVNVSPDGIHKSFTSMLLVCALISIVILLLSPATRLLLSFPHQDDFPHLRRRAALPPQLRAPPR